MPPDEARTSAAGGIGLLLLCFFLSGLAALVYQTAWTRHFAFVFGTSELAVASVLAAYMGGLALGAAVVGRVTTRIHRPILVYGLLELGIGLAALAVPLGVRVAQALYVAVFGSQSAPADEGGLATALFYLVCAFAILLVPTALMGATLPLLARHAVRRRSEIGSRIGALYAINTAGAVTGTILTGFVLLPSLGLSATVWLAVATNVLVFAAAAALARRAPVSLASRRVSTADHTRQNRWILPLIAISGAVSFTYEVLWTRLLGHVLGGSVYAFATMLATFLTGIALGSWIASQRVASSRQSAATGFAWAQVGAGLLSLVAYLGIDSTPGWVEAMDAYGPLRMLLDSGIASAILLPGTLCIGATFPLAVRVLAREPQDAAAATARVYAWNTVGAIVGAVGAGFFLIPELGFALTLAAAVSTNAVLAIAASTRARPRKHAALLAAVALLASLAVVRPEPPWSLLRFGTVAMQTTPGEVVYHGVGRSASVLLRRIQGGWQLSSNGLAESVIHEPGVRVGRFVIARWLGALPSWGRPGARSMLIVGFGGGLVVEAAAGSIERIEVVEIEEEILRANREIGAARGVDPLADPRLHVTINDARSALLLTRERYDAIVSQPSHPWTAAAAHLYTREFFELVRDHLTEDGVFVQWMGLAFVDAPLLRTLVATLAETFPHVRLYRPASGGVLFTGAQRPFEPETGIAKLLREDPSAFAELGVNGGADVAAHLLLDDAGARAFARGAAINTDDRNLLQMRSPRIVRMRDRGPVAAAVDEALREHDPYGSVEPEAWDRVYLVSRMLASGLDSRAREIAQSGRDPVESQVLSGLRNESLGRIEEAVSSYEAALRLEPATAVARMRLLELYRTEDPRRAVTERKLAELAEGARGSIATVIHGWSLEAEAAWDDLRSLDGELARIGSTDPAFAAAARLRATWRAETRDALLGAEAVSILDASLPLRSSLDDLVLRARTAGIAGYRKGAAATLAEVLRKVRPIPAHRRTIQRAIHTTRALPSGTLTGVERRNLLVGFRNKLR